MIIQKQAGLKLISQISIKEGSKILDLGCGTGYLASVLGERVGAQGKVIGVDPDVERIELAKELYSTTHINVEFLVGDDQSFPADKYDLIFANAVIHWIVDKARALEKIYASLKPGGCFVFTTLNQPSFSLFETILGPTITNDTLQSLHWESKEFYNDLALSTGFVITLLDVREESYHFPNIDSVINFLKGVFKGQLGTSKESIDEMKQRHVNDSFDVLLPRLTAILSKP
jgi:ubiquinone/menaquinone biosynthesis C-methylase UbiE